MGQARSHLNNAVSLATWRRLVVPGLSTLIVLLILLGLGTWQVHRLHWKEGILARIAAAEMGTPVPLTQNPDPYSKVWVTGRFRFDQAVEFGAEVRDTRTGPTMGFYQVVPLDRGDARMILVDRGWTPEGHAIPLDAPAGTVTVVGYVRPGERERWFSAADDPAVRRFYTLDPRAIGSAVGISDPEPFTLVTLGPKVTGSFPTPAQHLPRPPNNHLSYAITWYALAAALIVIFGVRARKAQQS
jgi:surfeit locus 1 family protein